MRRMGPHTHYESTYQRFPSAAIYANKENPVPHSWRIAILPFLDELDLYQQYDLNQAWDSPHNQKVTAKMPEVFRHPLAQEGTTNSSYFVVSGEGTMFPPSQKRIGFGNIVDGTSNTIMLVAAKRDTHWAKPEDIPFDREKMLDLIQGFEKDRIEVGVSDGSVTVLHRSMIEKEQFNDLLEISDGRIVEWPILHTYE